MKRAALLLAAFLIPASMRADVAVPVTTNLQAREIDGATSRYLEKPTDVSVSTLGHRHGMVSLRLLWVRMDTSAGSKPFDNSNVPPRTPGPLPFSELRFQNEYVPRYVAAIDQYLAWAAIKRPLEGESPREIAQVPTWGGQGESVLLKFTQRQASDEKRLLAISVVTIGWSLDDEAQFYDEKNATELKRLLLSLSAGTLQAAEIEGLRK